MMVESATSRFDFDQIAHGVCKRHRLGSEKPSGEERMARQTRVLAEGVYFGEGPRWHAGRLWFSDFYAQAVKSVSLSGDVRVEFELDDRPSGLGWTPDGTMLIVSMTKRQLLKRTPGGAISVHADLSGIATYHCNDMVVDAAGRAYVGNFGFNLDAAIEAKGIEGVLADHPTAKLALVQPDGRVSVAASDMHFPNGTVITPDGKTLIVGQSLGADLVAFDVGADGGLTNRRTWASCAPRVPDGICLDAKGRIWIANPIAAECALIAEGGEVVEVVETGDNCFACMLGGEDGHSLFMLTAKSSNAHEAAQTPTGRVLVAEVDTPRAGLP
jgi:sugar lactone lactonase YvrE